MHRLVFAMAAALVVALAPAAFAQEARKYDTADTVTLTSVDTETGRIETKTDDGKAAAFRVDEATVITAGSEARELASLEAGDRIAVNARAPAPATDAAETPIAESIEVLADGVVSTQADDSPLDRLPEDEASQ